VLGPVILEAETLNAKVESKTLANGDCQVKYEKFDRIAMLVYHMLVYQTLDSLIAPYLIGDCQLVASCGHRWLQLADVNTCIVPWTNTHLSDRIFAVVSLVYSFKTISQCTFVSRILNLSHFAGC